MHLTKMRFKTETTEDDFGVSALITPENKVSDYLIADLNGNILEYTQRIREIVFSEVLGRSDLGKIIINKNINICGLIPIINN